MKKKLVTRTTNERKINSEFYKHSGVFFSPSKYATEQQPYGPYADRYCSPDDPEVIEALELTRLTKLRLI
jgi:hypothetical protein